MEKAKRAEFQNHTRLVPPFHFFVLPVLAHQSHLLAGALKDGVTFFSVWSAVVALALLMAGVLCA